MKTCLAGVVVFWLMGCNSSNRPQKLSTVDSNVAGTPDSIPASLYIDSHRVDTSFPVAMDSAGPTVLPQDTHYQKKKTK